MSQPEFDCSHSIEIDDEPRHHLVIANEFVRAFAVEIAPGDRTLCHHHPNDYFLYVASGTEIISAARDEEPKRLNYQDGECELSTAGLTHVVENLGDKPFRNVVVELLPRAQTLQRGARPTAIKGEPEIEPVLEKPPGVVLRIGIQPGGELEIPGPAVLASPYDEGLMLKELDAYDIPLDGFRKLMWVCAPRTVAVKNVGSKAARLLLFQIGRNG